MIGAIPCVAAAGVLGLAIARWMERRGAPRAARIATVAFCMVNPITWEALRQGHPEDLLGATFCVAAVLAALRGHRRPAGLLLGMALVTWQWSADAVLPLLVALPLSAAWWFSRRRTPDDALALMALIFLLCSLLDPGTHYRLPFLLSLLAWEGLVRHRLPVVSLASSLATPIAVIVGVWLAVRLYLPRRIARARVARPPLAVPDLR